MMARKPRESGAVDWCSISETGPISGWISDHHKRGPRLWSRYRLGNTLTARSVEGRVPKRNIGPVRYRRQADCPADSGQLVASGKLVQILVNENVLFDANVNRRDMLPVHFFKVCLV